MCFSVTALLLGTDGRLPTVGVPETVTATMNHAATGEAHELGMQGGKSLGEVFAQTVSFIGVLRHQRDHVDIDDAILQDEDLQGSVLDGLRGSQCCLVFLPGVGIGCYCRLCQQPSGLCPIPVAQPGRYVPVLPLPSHDGGKRRSRISHQP